MLKASKVASAGKNDSKVYDRVKQVASEVKEIFLFCLSRAQMDREIMKAFGQPGCYRSRQVQD
jgi:hypothetical protein